VEHNTTIPDRPTGTALALLANEAIFDSQSVMGKLILIEQVAKFTVEVGVLIISNLYDSILDSECFRVIVTQLKALDLWGPTIQSFPIK
jgi:hypothetical protein